MILAYEFSSTTDGSRVVTISLKGPSPFVEAFAHAACADKDIPAFDRAHPGAVCKFLSVQSSCMSMLSQLCQVNEGFRR